MPPASARSASGEIPAELRDRLTSLTLAEVIDVALRNSPRTRETWAAARAAAEAVGSERSAYYPFVDLDVGASKVKQAAVGGRFTIRQSTYGPSLDLSWLLLDFGGRKGEVEKARQALLEGDWTHNVAIQRVVLDVSTAYYEYLDAKAQLSAFEASVKEAEANLEAADVRRESGVATVADVLQAKTSLSQARLLLETTRGQIATSRGALATSAGLPANVPLDAGVLPASAPVGELTEEVDALIARALSSRPDLGAARSNALEAAANIAATRAEGLPRVELNGTAGRLYYDPSPAAQYSDNWSASLLLTVPLFHGFQHAYDTRKAREDLATAEAQASTIERDVVLDVWTSYYLVKTAAARVGTARDLLDSATESEKVALGRYKEGVGSILDLLTAQAALATARAAEIRARSDWFIAMARLAHDTGVLGPATETKTP